MKERRKTGRKTGRKRFLTILLGVCLVCGLAPLSAKAVEAASENAASGNTAAGDTLTGIKYLDRDGNKQTCERATVVTPEDTTWGTHTDGGEFENVWYVVNQDVTINSRVIVADKVHLILMDDCTLTVNGGIEVQKIGTQFPNVRLFIYGQSENESMGKLKATSNGDAATIGSQKDKEHGNISFYGGDIYIENKGEGLAVGQGEYAVCIIGGRVAVKAQTVAMKDCWVDVYKQKYWKITSEGKPIEKSNSWENYTETSHEMTFELCTEHEIIPTYKDDKSHVDACKWCGYEIQNETHSHHYNADGNCDCGAIKTLYRTENGDTAYAGCRLLENHLDGTFDFSDTWYVVTKDVTVRSKYIDNDVNIIVTNDSTLTLPDGLTANSDISIYGSGNVIIDRGVAASSLRLTDVETTITVGASDDEGSLVAVFADMIQLSGKAVLTSNNHWDDDYLYWPEFGLLEENNTVQLDPSRCWEIRAKNSVEEAFKSYHPSEASSQKVYLKDYVRIVSRENHNWSRENDKHICSVCKEEVTHTTETRYISNELTKTITAKCLDGVCPDKGFIKLGTPEVPDSLVDLVYDGEEHPARITENTIQGVTPEITYSYQAPGKKTYTQMGKGKKPVDAGAYTATVSLTGADSRTVSVSVDFVIAPAAPVVTWPGETSSQRVAYTGSEIRKDSLTPPTVTLQGTDKFSDIDKITYSYRKESADGEFTSGLPTELGTYEVKASISSIGNYAAATSEDVMTLTIIKGKNELTTALTCDDYMYEKGKTPEPKAVAKEGEVTYKYALVGTEGTPTDEGAYSEKAPTYAGTYAVKAYVQETKHYLCFVSDAVTFTITPSTVTPNMPEAVLQAAHSAGTVGKAALPDGWGWSEEDKKTALAVNTPLTATAIYTAADKGNYVTESVEITLTRKECDQKNTEARNQIPATCMTGGYSGDFYCADCGAFIKKGYATEALGHMYGLPQYTWETDATGRMTCTAVKACTHTGCADTETDHSITETVFATDEVTQEPTCEVRGIRKYTAVFTKDGFTTQTKTEDIATTKHPLTAVAAKEATATESGNKAYFVCDNCGRYFEDSEGAKEITDKNSVVIPAKGNTPAVPDNPGTSEPGATPANPETSKPEATPANPGTSKPEATPANPGTSKPEATLANPGTSKPGTTPGNSGTSKPGTTPGIPAAKPAGTKIKDSTGAAYKVISAKGKTPAVRYLAPGSSAKGTVTIPATVVVGKVKYKVTSIAKNAFKNRKKIKKIVIGSNICSIGKNAFTGCTKLRTIIIKSKKLTMKSVAKGAFSGISEKAVIKVPKSKYKAYKKLFRAKGLSKKVKFKK